MDIISFHWQSHSNCSLCFLVTHSHFLLLHFFSPSLASLSAFSFSSSLQCPGTHWCRKFLARCPTFVRDTAHSSWLWSAASPRLWTTDFTPGKITMLLSYNVSTLFQHATSLLKSYRLCPIVWRMLSFGEGFLLSCSISPIDNDFSYIIFDCCNSWAICEYSCPLIFGIFLVHHCSSQRSFCAEHLSFVLTPGTVSLISGKLFPSPERVLGVGPKT